MSSVDMTRGEAEFFGVKGAYWRSWRGLVAATVVGALTCAVLFLTMLDRQEPVYLGKRLSWWVEAYAPSGPGPGSEQWRQADAAVREAGTNGFPTLWRMFRAQDSAMTLWLAALAQKQHVMKFRFVPAGEKVVAASRAFEALGPAGAAAMPELMRLYEEDGSPWERAAIEDAFTWIGPGAKPALPILLREATNTDNKIRANALWALGAIHTEPELCVPVLIGGLHDSDGWARASAAHAVGKFGTNALAAVPDLEAMLPTNGMRLGPSGFPVEEWTQARGSLKEIEVDSVSDSTSSANWEDQVFRNVAPLWPQ